VAALPKVTVCIPVYNRAQYVGAAIESVLDQDFEDFELLIVDDGSTDSSMMIARSYTDPRVRIEQNLQNRGIPYTRGRCLELARGEYVALLDSDDRMAKGRLRQQVDFLDQHPEIATVGGWVAKFDGSGRTIKRLIKPRVPGQLHAWLLFRCCHANTTLMGRAAIMKQFGYRPEYPVSEDYDLLVRLSQHHRMANLPRVLTYMREHGGRITNSTAALSFETKSRLAVDQFSRLGIDVSDLDLERHFKLSRLSRSDLAEEGFVDWAAAWLHGISRANREQRIYDSRHLDNVLGLVWAQLCWKLGKVEGRLSALRRYFSSPLRNKVAGLLTDNLLPGRAVFVSGGRP
jgi:glycosyltransferase involved in cell wall biosynthesis